MSTVGVSLATVPDGTNQNSHSQTLVAGVPWPGWQAVSDTERNRRSGSETLTCSKSHEGKNDSERTHSTTPP